MRACEIVVITPDGRKTEYESIADFWRQSKYSLSAIRKAFREDKPMKNGTRIKRNDSFKVIGFKGTKTKKFRSFEEAGRFLGVSKTTIRNYANSGDELKGWTFDIL